MSEPLPNYVNDLPEGSPPKTRRCAYVFKCIWPHGQPPQWVKGHSCGLPAEPHDSDPEVRCYFHSARPRENDGELKDLLRKAVACRAYLGEAHLEGANLMLADLEGANLPG